MLHLTIVAVGKIKERYLQDGIREYSKRLSGYLKLNIIEVNDESCPENPSGAEAEKARRLEGEKILKVLKSEDYGVLLDLEGKEMDSLGLAGFLEDKALTGRSRITFIIGGSLGVAEEVRRKIDYRWSLSRLTFPHQLVRLVLLEQIYRAVKINKGEPYHK